MQTKEITRAERITGFINSFTLPKVSPLAFLTKLQFLSGAGVVDLEEEEPGDSMEEASSGEDPPPVAPRACRRPPHAISTSDSD